MPVLPSSSDSYAPQISGEIIIQEALELIEVLGEGQKLDAAKLATCKRTLNHMLDSANAEGLMVTCRVRGEFTLTAADADIEIGPGGDIDIARPAKFDGVALVPSGQTVEIPLNYYSVDEWRAIATKDDSGQPCGVYDDGANPIRTLTFWPVPSAADLFVYYVWQQLAQISNVSSKFSLPPSFAEWLSFSLAVRIAPKFGKQANADVIEIANNAKAKIKSLNSRPITVQSDYPGTATDYNIRTDRPF